jgi:plasmid stabilization system protein ParE
VTPELLVRPRAKAELGEAFRWYEEQREGLGREFLRAALETLFAIEAAPERYPRVRGKVRRALLRRFPYALLYLAEAEQTVVIACFHSKRDPRRWHSRW